MSFLFCRGSRIPIGDGIFIDGSIKNAGLRPELDDVIAGLEVDSLNHVKFFTRLQVRGRIINSLAYRNCGTPTQFTTKMAASLSMGKLRCLCRQSTLKIAQ